MESLQFVGCSWFMGLIGLVFRFTQNKFTETEHVCDPAPPLSLLDYTRCPRGSQLSSASIATVIFSSSSSTSC